jgi:hypothetical protein
MYELVLLSEQHLMLFIKIRISGLYGSLYK